MPDSTRDRIVEAAYRALVRRGYHDTSMKDIAEEAGVAPGLAHYYFQSKEHLLVEAIRHACDPLLQEWHAAAASAPAGLDAAVALAHQGLEMQKQQLKRNLDLFTLVFDMFGVGLHNERIGTAVNEFVQEDRERIAAVARAVIEALPVPPRAGTDAIAAVVWSGLTGIMLQRLIDPAFDAVGAIDALWDMIVAYVATHAGAPVNG